MRSLTGLLCTLVLLSSCASTGMPAADVAAEEQAIRELDRQWVERVAARDAAWIASLYTPQGRLLAPNAPPAVGRAAVEQAWQGFFQLPNLSLSFQPTEIRIDDDAEMAYDVGTYTMSFDAPQGTVRDQGKYLVVWEKVAGEWKVAADMFNSNVPMQ